VLGFIPPALPKLSSSPPVGEEWVHEISADGWRLQIHKKGRRVALYSERGVDLTRSFPSIAAASAALPARSVILDGELVARGPSGLSDPRALRFRRRRANLSVGVFDVLELNGADLRALPLLERKEKLARLLNRTQAGGIAGTLAFVQASPDVDWLLRLARELGLEGIVSKRKSGAYRSGHHSDWLKVKCST
jgi:bifunctional non-homologous end joining protein LigD